MDLDFRAPDQERLGIPVLWVSRKELRDTSELLIILWGYTRSNLIGYVAPESNCAT